MCAKRVSAIIIDKDKILLMHRIKPGKEYYVLPGGSVEDGESLPEALRREVQEETCLDIAGGQELAVINDPHDERPQHVFLVTRFTGKLKIGSPEKERQNKNNRYRLKWHKTEDLNSLLIYPESAKNIIKTIITKNEHKKNDKQQ